MKILLVLMVTLFSFTIQARDSSSGCGPGWYVFQENSLVSSALRATTNGFLFPTVTVGMTIGTSNCTQHKIVLKEKETLHFATHNYYELMREFALGEGEFLSAYFSTLGCQESEREHFISAMKKDYHNIFKDTQARPETLVEETFKSIFSDEVLLKSCSLS